ncbi:MAG: TIGR00645 family protein [Caulobacteraceae bacterium]
MSKPRIEVLLDRGLFATRWLLAPIYVGLAIALLVLLAVFGVELWRETTHLLHVPPERLGEAGILMALGLIDLSLSANLLLIVIFSGYENFVSRIVVADGERRPDWMGTVDFSGLKIKLIASIVAISAISLLRTFLSIGDDRLQPQVLLWQVTLHLTFVASGIGMAVMDWIVSKTDKHAPSAASDH